ncbi:MAG: BamA/TamA family outer membrane protein [Chlorobi bacterium]|nr:BamA/TamA family outer membrane protein [Chlorobiota bacterium]
MNKNILILLLLICTVSGLSQPKPAVKKNKKVNLAFIPVISYNRSFDAQIGIMASGYFDFNKKDTISPASMVSFSGNYFTSNTIFFGLFNRMFFNEDKWRTKAAIGYGDIKFQTFMEMPDGLPGLMIDEENGEFVDYRTMLMFLYGEASRRVLGDLFLGIRFTYSYVNTVFDSDYVPDETLNLLGLGLQAEYDTRNNVFNPKSGMNGKIKTFSFFEALGSTETYHRINLEYNKYFTLGKKAIIMARFYSAVSAGDSIPFNGQNTVGRDDLRGYTNGKFRANQVYDIQSEYRWSFYKKWGMVAFTGVAIATDNLKGDNYSGLLPGAGAGIRFMAIPKRKINVGVDAAVGKDDWGIYFRIGEPFTR